MLNLRVNKIFNMNFLNLYYFFLDFFNYILYSNIIIIYFKKEKKSVKCNCFFYEVFVIIGFVIVFFIEVLFLFFNMWLLEKFYLFFRVIKIMKCELYY